MGHTFADLYKKANTKKESCVTTILKELFVEIELSVVWLLHLKYDHIRTLTALLRAERSWEYEHSMDLVGLLFAKLHKMYSWRISLIQKTSTIKDWYVFARKNKISHSCLISHSLNTVCKFCHLGYTWSALRITGVWLPLTSRIYETLLTGSEW